MINATRVAARYLMKVAGPGHLKPDVRRKVNVAFDKAGLGGRVKFDRPQKGYSLAVNIMGDFGIELDEIPDSFLFREESRHFSVRLAFKNPDDPFSPIPIVNSKLAISYTMLHDNVYEVVAYLS